MKVSIFFILITLISCLSPEYFPPKAPENASDCFEYAAILVLADSLGNTELVNKSELYAFLYYCTEERDQFDLPTAKDDQSSNSSNISGDGN